MKSSDVYSREVILDGKLLVMISFTTSSKLITKKAEKVGGLNRLFMSREQCLDRIGWVLVQTDGVGLVRLLAKNLDQLLCFNVKLRQILDAVKQCPLTLSMV